MKLIAPILVLVCLMVVSTASLVAQVEVKDTLILDNPNPSQRVIKGLAHPKLKDNAVSAETVLYNKVNLAMVGGSQDSLELSLSPALDSYEAGCQIYFFAQASNKDTVMINVDGLGYRELVKSMDKKLDSADLAMGLIVHAIYDGNQFVVVSELNKACPNGYLSVNDHYCIEIDEHLNMDFWQASAYCGDSGAKLCSWSEWYIACQKLGASLNDMTNNWEFVDSGQNYYAASLSDLGVKTVGENACEESSGSVPQAVNKGFRCCYTK